MPNSRYAKVPDGETLIVYRKTVVAGLFSQDGSVRQELTFRGQIDEGVETSFQKRIKARASTVIIPGARIFTGQESTGDYPIGLGDGTGNGGYH
jgi:hypothetical protein